MSYQFDFEPTHRILRGRFEGDVNDADLAAFCSDAAQKVAATDPLRELTDFTDVVTFKSSAENIRRLARTGHEMPDPSRPRVIVAPSDLIFGTARMYEIEGEAARPYVYVVRSLSEALAIFGISGELHYESIDSYLRTNSKNPAVSNHH
jgi:hypothetical protein